MFDDKKLVARIAEAYRASVKTEMGPPGLFWFNEFVDMKRSIHDALMADDILTLQDMLRNPDQTNLLYGFDNLNLNFVRLRKSSDWENNAKWNHRLLVNLSMALGTFRYFNPESPMPEVQLSVDDILKEIDKECGFNVDFPRLADAELGLETSRGLVSERAVQAIYQTCRISSLCSQVDGPRILEIGAGLGRTAYYCWQKGIRNYTIVDIPMTAVAQAYFLGRNIGEANLKLYGESGQGSVCILPPQAFFNAGDRFDVALNVDSMTEIAREVAQKYLAAIESRADIFLSVNHEANPFTVRELLSDEILKRTKRNRYWMREGYVEEIIDFKETRLPQLEAELSHVRNSNSRRIVAPLRAISAFIRSL